MLENVGVMNKIDSFMIPEDFLHVKADEDVLNNNIIAPFQFQPTRALVWNTGPRHLWNNAL